MPCYRPIQAYRRESGEIKFSEAPRDLESLKLPCGRCTGCRLQRASAWATRCTHEAELYDRNCMVNFDYAPEHLPEHGSLYYRDIQLFNKKLRKRFRGHQPSPNGKYPIRFFLAAEYGDQSWRAHYHMLLFNFDFQDKYPWGRSITGETTYRSPDLEELWTKGNTVLGSVTPASAAYIARYSLKKVMGRQASADFYTWVDTTTGDVCSVRPEFCTMSRKPGIGGWWLDKYQADVLPCDYVIKAGNKTKTPRYYDNRYKQLHELKFEDVQAKRQQKIKDQPLHERSEARLAVAEEVAAARLEHTYGSREAI